MGNAPFLATELRGDTAWIGLLYVPPDMRRRGVGRALFERWARDLPMEVQQIKLLAVNLDGEFTTGFWRKLGFEVVDEEFSESEIATCYMVRPARPIAPSLPRHDPARDSPSQNLRAAA